MNDIFLSYSSQDRERLTPLVDALEAQGWTVFWDHRAIKVADDWHKVIGTAIQQCTCVIVVWSENSVASTWVREEALIAKDRGVLYPIFIDQVPIPFGFNLIQTADFTNWNGKITKSIFLELRDQLSARLDGKEVRPVQRSTLANKVLTTQLKPQKSVLLSEIFNSILLKSKLLIASLLFISIALGGYRCTPNTFRVVVHVYPNNAQIFIDGEIYKEEKQLSPGTYKLKVVADGYGTREEIITVEDNDVEINIDWFEPKMVLIPAGNFIMGCHDDKESDCEDDEKPDHKVDIKQFYLAKTEVTVGQFRAFVDATKYKTTAEQEGSCYSLDEKGNWGDVKGNLWKKLGFDQDDNHPVACVSHNDAKAYVEWLSKITGKVWRLPSEAEWEYAVRAGTETKYSWGKDIGSNNANCWADFCGDKFKYTSPSASFSANEYGLFDMHGNVWEWVEDKWHSDYNGAPNDGSAWVSGSSSARVLRGGSWAHGPQYLRSAYRGYAPDGRDSTIGFRPAQDYGE